MARLPSVGGDDGNWGQVLNDFLSVAHNADGTHKSSGGKTILPAQLASIAPIGNYGLSGYSGIPSAIDGTTVTDGMVVLFTNEASSVNNGLWVIHSGAWTRPTYYASGNDVTGAVVQVQGGNVCTGTLWSLQGGSPKVVDTNGTSWIQFKQLKERGFVSNYSLYYAGDIVIIAGNLRVVITSQVQASSSGFISASNYAVLQYLTVVDIRTYGAKVDGTTDDTAAIQNAINSFGTMGNSIPGTGGIVYFPPGYTRISATLDLPSNVHLRGAGFSSSVIQLLPNSNCHMITTHRSTGSGNSNAFWSSVTNMMLDGRRNNQGNLLSDCTLTPGSTTITSAAGTFQPNGTLIQGAGLLPGTTIVSGGGTGTITVSQPALYSALGQAPGASTLYQGGTTDRAGAVIPWCAIYHETNPYSAFQTGDNQFDPTHLFQDLRIYFMNGDGIRVHGRSDVQIQHVKVSFAVGNGFTLDFDTKLNGSMVEVALGCGLELNGHSSDQISNCKFYNCYAYGVWMHNYGGSTGEITMSNIDIQQLSMDGLRLDSQQGLIFDGTIYQSGFSNGGSSISVAAISTWQTTQTYNNFRSSSVPSVVKPTTPNGYLYACYAAGTSGSSEPIWPTSVGSKVTDGTVTWVCITEIPAAVSLVNASYNIINAITQQDNYGLRLKGTSANNSIRLAHKSTITGSGDVSTDSLSPLGATNNIIMNGVFISPLIEYTTNKGIANGYASLNSSGVVPASQLPTSASGEIPNNNIDKLIRPVFFTLGASQSSGALTANLVYLVRVVVPVSGTLHDLAVYVATTSGNINVGVYDTGDASSGNRTRLYQTGSVSTPAASNWRIVGDPNLSVTVGQYLDFALVIDNTTATLGTINATNSAIPTLPTNFGNVVGGASPKLVAKGPSGSFTLPTTIAESSISANFNSVLIIARVG